MAQNRLIEPAALPSVFIVFVKMTMQEFAFISFFSNTNSHEPSMVLGKVLKCKSLEKRCTVAKASKPLPINHNNGKLLIIRV